MRPDGETIRDLTLELAELRTRLSEAEQALEAIRRGEVDALVISTPEGEQVYTLEGADTAYRLLVESMREGAVTLLEDGSILYVNQHFSEMVQMPLEKILGSSFSQFVHPADQHTYQALRQVCGQGNSAGEVQLISGGRMLPAFLAMNCLQLHETKSICMVVTDLTEQKRNEQIAADERLARAILEQAADCIVVCDEQCMIIRASQDAYRYASGNPLRRHFDEVFSLELNGKDSSDAPERFSCPALLKGGKVENLETRLLSKGSTAAYDLLVNASPLLDGERRILGCVISMRDITSRKRDELALRTANERLAAANQRLSDADRRKDEFLAMLAHELRNPLAPVRYAVQILNSIGLDHPMLNRQRDLIDRQVSHMARLLDDLLDVSRITRGKIELKRQPVHLADVIAHAVETTRPLMETRGHTLHLSPPPDDLRVTADLERLIQIIGNLLSNAAKFTENGGQIWLQAARDGGSAVIRVRDTGVGLSPEMIERVFDLFAQADHSLARAQGGLGIGLTITKRLVEMHGGSVEVFSGGIGKGSEFTVRLPALPQEQPAAGGTGLPAEYTPFRALRILVVDDVIDSAASLAELMTMWGHQARVAYDGHAALKEASDFKPELVLLDIGMPVMDGYEVAHRLRQEHGRSVILVAMTGYGQDSDRQKTFEAGFDHHLVKPVDMGALCNLLSSLFA